jgi:hypothetical protein
MFSIWTVIQRPTWEDEPWIADLWVRMNDGSECIYETVVDPDYEIFLRGQKLMLSLWDRVMISFTPINRRVKIT